MDYHRESGPPPAKIKAILEGLEIPGVSIGHGEFHGFHELTMRLGPFGFRFHFHPDDPEVLIVDRIFAGYKALLIRRAGEEFRFQGLPIAP